MAAPFWTSAKLRTSTLQLSPYEMIARPPGATSTLVAEATSIGVSIFLNPCSVLTRTSPLSGTTVAATAGTDTNAAAAINSEKNIRRDYTHYANVLITHSGRSETASKQNRQSTADRLYREDVLLLVSWTKHSRVRKRLIAVLYP